MSITIVIENGVCVEVLGVPEEWSYIVQDHGKIKEYRFKFALDNDDKDGIMVV